jgi:hypothetical protein
MKAWIWAGLLSVISVSAWSEQADPAAMPSLDPPPSPAASAPAAAPLPVPAASYEEAFLDYRLEIQRRIQEAWAGYLKTYRGSLPRGRVVFSYHVNADGKITLVQPKGGGQTPLTALAQRAIIEANAELVPFPEIIRARHPAGYFNQIAFVLK